MWDDIRAVYEPYLALFPDHDWHRSGYAKWAAECGRWREAQALFEAIAHARTCASSAAARGTTTGDSSSRTG